MIFLRDNRKCRILAIMGQIRVPTLLVVDSTVRRIYGKLHGT
jgi:hypothetical protein